MSFSNLHRGIHVSGDTFFTDVRARPFAPTVADTAGRTPRRALTATQIRCFRDVTCLEHARPASGHRTPPPCTPDLTPETQWPSPPAEPPVHTAIHRRAKIVCRRPRGLTDVRFPLPPHRRDSWLAYRPSPPLRSPGTRRNSGGRPPFAPTSERRLDGARDGARDRRTSSGAL